MAGGTSNYDRGNMEINGHEKTYSGFMAGSVYGGALIIVTLFYPILMFAVGLGWVTSLIATFVLGILLGIGLKLKGIWYGLLIGFVAIAGFFSLIIALLV